MGCAVIEKPLPVANVTGKTNANPHQQQAILTTNGPVLIIAGPGSGKTYTLVERIVRLIIDKKVPPESLLVVTFTDKAARELTTRISNRLNELSISFNLNEMYLGTFHSICLRLLEEFREFTRLKRNYTLMDQFDQQYFLYQKIRAFYDIPDVQLVIGDVHKSSRWNQSEQLVKWVNKVSEEALNVDLLDDAPDLSIRALASCYRQYQTLLHESNYLDFSGIQYEALMLLEKNPTVLEELRGKLSYLMVDEYQDTNTIQERILLLLAGEQGNLCVVGDDDQGLYRFRGATIRNILEFPQLFTTKTCKQITLSTNYRSHPDIIGFYNRWMDAQTWTDGKLIFRFPKRIEAKQGDFPDVPTVVRLAARDKPGEDHLWHAEVMAFLQGLKAAGLEDWNQVAFLFKSVKNERVLALGRYLEGLGIPVYSPRSNMFFEREEIRLMIGALIFLFPQFPQIRQWDPNITLDIWSYYDNECFKPFTDELRKPENKALLDWAKSLAKKHRNLTRNEDYAFSGLFYQLLQFPLFARYLSDDALYGVDKGRAGHNFATFSQLLTKFEYLHYISVLTPQWLEKNITDLFNQFLRFLEDGGINEYEDVSEYAPKGYISFLTVHQSKGLEFPVVVVGSLDAVPRKQYTALDELLEDGGYLSKGGFEPLEHIKNFDFRRLYYTAFSRAQNLLVLAAQERDGHGKSPSKYFDKVFYEQPNWRAVNLGGLHFERVKEMNLKKEYSFTSHITLFENCAEQYRFFKELAFNPIRVSPMLFGTLVHQTIEDIHKTVLRGEEHQLSHEQIKEWFQTNYAMLSKKERVYLAQSSQDAALGHVLRYYERENGHWDRIREAEVDISLVKDQYILTGSVDLVRGEGGTVEIIDFKSEKKPDIDKERDKLVRYKHQLEVYAHLVEKRTGQKVSRMHLYYTGEESGNPYITFTKDDKSIGKTIGRFDEIVARIENKDYSMTARPAKLCVNCDMRSYCDNKSWKFRK